MFYYRFDKSQSSSPPLWYSTQCITNQEGVCKSYTIEDDKAGWSFLVNRYFILFNFCYNRKRQEVNYYKDTKNTGILWELIC